MALFTGGLVPAITGDATASELGHLRSRLFSPARRRIQRFLPLFTNWCTPVARNSPEGLEEFRPAIIKVRQYNEPRT